MDLLSSSSQLIDIQELRIKYTSLIINQLKNVFLSLSCKQVDYEMLRLSEITG